MNKEIDYKIKGLTLIEQFITEKEAKELWELIKQQKWRKELSRDTLHYGERYDYNTKTLKTDVPKIPEWLSLLIEKIEKEGEFKQNIDQIIINRYIEGQGISPHIDHVKLFGDTIATLSLGIETNIFFKKLNNNSVSVMAKARSLIVLKDEARYKWSHSLKLDKNKKSERISITFRTIKTKK